MHKNRMFLRRIRKILPCFLTCLLLISWVMPTAAQNTSVSRKIVKAGFFSADGYHNQDDDGMRSGYGYDFLKMAENYSNWKFNFVGYELGWSDMLDMLDSGEIDLLTFAQKNPEREEKYDFSDKPIGTGSIMITVKKGDTRYSDMDAETWNGIRVGIQTGATHEEAMQEYASKQGFTFEPVYYNTLDELKEALQEGKDIDAAIGSSMRPLYNETKVAEMEPIDFYVMVKKGNTVLLNQINEAISQMDMNSPSWRTELKDKYFANTDEEEFMFTQDSKAYLEQLKEDKKVFTVVTNPDLAPYSYFEDGQAKGIAPQVFKRIADSIGLEYQMYSFDTYEEYNAFVREGKADIDLTCFRDYGLAADHGVDLSSAYLTTSLAMLTLDTYDGNLSSIAELKSVGHNTTYTDELLDTVKSEYYDTHGECVDAVLEGKVDATYLYTYTAQKAVEEDVKNRLMYSIMPEYTVELAFGVQEDEDYRLMEILNEGIRCIKGTYIQHVIQNEISDIAEKDSVISLIYDYPELALGILGAFIVTLFIIGVFVFRSVNEKKRQQQAKELSRFMGYVCEANETVLEVNLDKSTCLLHSMENGILISRDASYMIGQFQNIDEIMHPVDFKRLKKELQVENIFDIFTKQKNGLYFEARGKDKDGEYCWYSYTIRVIPKDRNHPNNFILFKKNINQAKLEEERQRQMLEDALETAKSASTAKGQFLSRMSHEIRTPLNAVIGYMDIAKDSGDNAAKMMHCVENSDLAARHLLNIINDVLDISSIESGKMKIADEEFDLKKQLTTITTLFYNQAKEKKIHFDVQLQGVTQEWVVGDGLRVNQILMNLLSNAMKFTPEDGSIILKVTQLNQEEKRIFMSFEVSDTGIGMSEEYQKRLFKPFEQESAMTAQKYGGSGLGLSITYNLIQMMGGSISVKSQEGQGTTFKVSLHFGKSVKNHETVITHQDYSHLRALIVDDEDSSCEYMKALLKRCKIKSDVVKDGEAAIRQILRRQGSNYGYDLCLMDWNMPGMNGIEVAKQIREQCDLNLPIIIATAYDVTDCEEQAKSVGVNKVIAKPLFQSTLFDLLVSTYGKYEPEESKEQNIANLKGMHVLLAEDNPMNMEIAVDILSKNGMIVEEAEDGKIVYEKFLQAPAGTYDVILMDIQMPIMDGYQATAAIRASANPQAAVIPIIAMTANAFAEDVTAALASGMNGHISKPIDYDKLFSVLNKVSKTEEKVNQE